MKKFIILILLFVTVKTFGQGFPSTDSLHRYDNRFITNSAINAFTDYRLNTLLHGMINWIDSARLGTGGTVGVDTIYVVNDSTLRYKKNSVTYTFTFKGVYDSRRKVDTIYRKPGQDSIFYKMNGTERAIKDSTGGGGVATVNLDTVRTSTTVTITNDAGADAVIKEVSFPANKAGLMTPTDKGRLDSLYAGLLDDSIVVTPIGNGKQISFVRGDSLYTKKVHDTTYISWGTRTDSSLYALLDTASLRSLFSGAGGTPGGSNTQLQYNNSGAFGGTSGVTWDATNTGITISKGGLGTTQNNSSGLIISTPTAAAAGAQQISPGLHLTGNGWKTTATAASQPVDYRFDVVPVQGSTAPTAYLRVQGNINGGTYNQVAEFYADGMRIGGNNGGGINLSGNPGNAPSPGVITSSFGLAFGTASTTNPFVYDFGTTGGWGAVASGETALLRLNTGSAGFNQSSGVATHNTLDVKPRITQSGTASGITRAIRIEASLVSGAVDFRGFEITGLNSGYGFRDDSASVKHYLAGELNLGNSTDQGAFKAQITGGLYHNGTFSANGYQSASGTPTILTHQTDSTVTQMSLSALKTAINMADGNYTPTITNGTNIASTSLNKAHYIRNGNHVWVSVSVQVTCTAGSGSSDFAVSLPIASAIAGVFDIMGVCNAQSTTGENGIVQADFANDRATVAFTATTTSAIHFYIMFSYEVL